MKTLVVVGPNKGDREMVSLVASHEQVWMFEPLPEAFEWLASQNQGVDRLHLVNAACDVEASERDFNVYNIGGKSSSLGTCTEQARYLYANHDLSLVETITVQTVNLYDHLTAAGVDEIETLLIDAQGMDLTILRTVEPMIAAGRIRTIQAEADGAGFRHYDGLPDNSLDGFLKFMEPYPYQFSKVPNRNHFNFDIQFQKTE